jgi:hypothetical protein
VATLRNIFGWIAQEEPTNQQKILWVNGVAGSGKSTLTTKIASVLCKYGYLGAFLFFDRDVTERNDPTVVIRTLAYQLASSDPVIGTAIRSVVERNSNIAMSPLALQFQKLILEPLSAIKFRRKTVIVLDSLNECGTADERRSLLEVLTNDFTRLPSFIYTIVTSRPDIDIRNAFESQHHIRAQELDISSSINSKDILVYFRHYISLVRNKNRHLQLDNWPGEDIFQQLVRRASGLFVWASTACQFIDGHNPRKRLDVILNRDTASGAENALDDLYKTALEAINSWNDEDFVTAFRDIMGVILVARRPLSSGGIDALLQRPQNMPSMHTISHLGCVVQQGSSIRVLHPSFADFLMTQQRCGRDIWFFDSVIYHRRLAFRCLDRMSSVLKRNMCNMTLSIDRANESLPEDVSYSCLFWIDHICVIEEDLTPVIDGLHIFLDRHLLHWFEAMSILKRSRDTISLIDRLLNWLRVSSSLFHP